MEIDDNKTDGFELVINFSPNEGDPARVFKTMSGLIESFQDIEKHLISTIDLSLNASLVLEDVEKGSLKAKFRGLIEGIPDEALKDAEWKKIIGHFLLRSKKAILVWCADKNEIKSIESVKTLEGHLLKLAEETELKNFPAYAPIPVETLLSDISKVQDSLQHLEGDDKATYKFNDEEIGLNRDLIISSEVVREVLTQEVIKSSGTKILKVKKPDYLGQSMWGFVYDGRAIEAKITHEEWLIGFQARKVDVKPGDSIKVILYEEISYGYEAQVVHRHYEIEKVFEIIKPPHQRNIGF
ncbi:MAG: hypothetical protein JKX92_15345 [Porticoccaceae bacterium]|nr:hypothetical protein [Porticoccaceae bacterium]